MGSATEGRGSHRQAAGVARVSITFDELCRREKATYAERDKLAWYLAQMRARTLYERLRPQPRYSAGKVAP